MAAFTFRELKEIVAPYAGRAGKSSSAKETEEFARDVMRLLLYSGSDVAVRKVNILAYNGCISLPPEVEIPLNVKIGQKMTHLWDKWLTYHPVNEECSRWPVANNIIAEDGSYSPLAYELPEGGSQVGIEGSCEEADDAHVIIQGSDLSGNKIFTFHNGEQIPGEKLKIEKDKIRFGKVMFGSITGVVKPLTNGYITLHAVNPRTDERQFLANWAPSETRPQYRRFKIIARSETGIVHVSMLCRVRLRDSYHDNELTLFENRFAVILAAQQIQSEVNEDIQTANYKRQAIGNLLEMEGSYKKISGGPIKVFVPLSGAAVKNLIR